MNNLLKLEFALVALLLVISVFIRVGVLDSSAAPAPENPGLSTAPAETDPPETVPPTTVPPTEPPIKLTFGEDFTPASRDYFVYDCKENNVMAMSGSPDEQVYPASVTKLFTAYVALQVLDPDTVVTLGREVYMVSADSSLAYVKNGQKIAVSRLVEGMLLPSGNDAAYGLAVAAAEAKSGNSAMEPQDALAYFVNMMNETAQAEGMTGSHFANPDGYHDAEHYTTCADLITMARLALSNDLIRQYAATATDQVRFNNGDTAFWDNSNHLIDPESQYYHPAAIGLKTGHTSYAGFCLLSAFELDGEYIIIGTFGGVSPDDRYLDTLKLYEMVVAAKME